MANQTLNYNLQFTADTAQAKQQLQSLQNQLNQLTNINSQGDKTLPITKSVSDAQVEVNKLKVSLQEATNVNTGKLDLSKFSESLKRSGMSLEQYRKSLMTLGPEGQKAFVNLATAISRAEVPLKRTSTLMQNLGVTLKNTIKWQLSSTAIHSFMGAIQSAWGYAQDLNESLNNIRIVTGQNIDQMAQFAEKANQAAKALSATTTAYTDASLIYYQQGLEDKQVQERTDTTIKLSNVSRQSVEEVSNQMTAIWNNFYDGTKSLESYADAITALGAATASSSSEIATGIEKFAAVSDTVGLSYEYATAALATVTATTRQSADTVGTAFKTLFARIQDLELGETLEDGTDLGTYSQALETIGVNIKDSNGELKDMDIILEDIGAKWDTLSKDSQVALAQNVAGVRQYTQFMALMDNWDFMQENLETVRQSEGTLQEQADIYAESWEAANKRVQASLQSVYSQLINDEFFIDLTNGIGEAVDGLSLFIDTLGGAKGVLLTLGGIISNVFSKQIGQSIDNTIYKIRMLTTAGQQQAQSTKYQAVSMMEDMAKSQGNTRQGQALAQSYRDQAAIQKQIIDNSHKYSEVELQNAQILQDEIQKQSEINAEKARTLDLAEEEVAIQQKVLDQSYNKGNIKNYQKNLQEEIKNLQNVIKSNEGAINKKKNTSNKKMSSNQKATIDNINIDDLTKKNTILTKQMEELKRILDAMRQGKSPFSILAEDLKKAYQQEQALLQISRDLDSFNLGENGENLSSETISRLSEYTDKIQNMSGATDEAKQKAAELKKLLSGDITAESRKSIFNLVVDLQGLYENETNVQSLETKIRELGVAFNVPEQTVENFINSIKKASIAEKDFEQSNESLRQKIQQTSDTLKGFGSSISTFGQKLSSLTSTISSIGMLVNGVRSLVNTINDENATAAEKFASALMAIGMIGGSLGSTIGNVGNLVSSLGTEMTTAAAATGTAATATGTLGTAMLSVLGPIAAVVGALVAIGGIAYLIYRVVTAEERHHKQLEENAKAARKLVNVFEEAENAYNDLISSIENYESAKNALSELESGTTEWNTKLLEVNSTVLDLIEKFPELAGKVENVNGVLGFTTGALEDFEKSSLEKYNTAQALKVSSQINANKAEQDVLIDSFRMDNTFKAIGGKLEKVFQDYTKTNTGIDISKSYTDKETGITYYGAENEEERLGNYQKGISPQEVLTQTGLDSVYDQFLDTIPEITNEQYEQLAKAISKGEIAYDEENPAIFDATSLENVLNSGDSALISALQDNTSALVAMAAEYNSYEVANDTLSKYNIDTQLRSDSDDIYYENESSIIQDGIVNAIQDRFNNNKDSLVEAAKTEIQDSGKTDAEIAKDYLVSQGIINESADVAVKDNKITATDAEGNEISAVSDLQFDQILNVLAENKARDEYVAKYGAETAEAFSKASQAWEEKTGDKELADLLTTKTLDANNLSQQQIDILSQMQKEQPGIFSDNLNEIVSTIIEEAEAARNQALNSSNITAVNSALKDLSNISSMTAPEIEAVSKQLEDIFKQGGEKAVNAAVELSNKTGLQISELFGENGLFKDVDFANTSVSELSKVLDEAGFAGSNFTDILRILINTLGNLTPLERAINKYNELSGAMNLEAGKTIDPDTYSALSDEAKSYFTMMADGTWKLIGNAEQFKEIVSQEALGGFYDAIDSTTDKITAIQNTLVDEYSYGEKVFQKNIDNLGNNLSAFNESGSDWELAQKSAVQNQAITEDGQLVYDTEQLQTMVSLLEQAGDEQAQVYQNAIDQGAVTAEIVNGVAESYKNYDFTVQDVNNALSNLNIETNNEISAVLNTASSLSELNSITNTLYENTGRQIESTDAYNNSLIGIASQYENTEDEIRKFQNALESQNEAQIVVAKDDLLLATRSSELANKYDLSAEAVESYAKQLQKSGKYAGVSGKELAELAKDQLRYDRAIEKCNDNMEDWKKTLKNLSSQKLLDPDMASDLADAYGDMFDIDGSQLSDSFLRSADNLKLLEDASNGSEEAYNRLQQAIQDDLNVTLNLDGNEDFLNKVNEIENRIAEVPDGMDISAYLDDADFLNELENLVNAAGMTADQATDYLSSMGIDAEVVEVEDEAAETQEHQNIVANIQRQGYMNVPGAGATGDQIPIDSVTYNVENIPQTSTKENKAFSLKVTSANKSSGGGVKHSTSSKTGGGGGSGGGGGGGGGGSSKPAKKVQKTKFTDLGDRYHTITKQLEDQSRAVEKLSKLEDRLYGAAKIKAMEKQSKELKKQIELNKQKAEEAKKYLEEDTTELNASVADFNAQFGTNLTVQFDDEGNITNYREIVEEMQRVTNEWEDHLNSLATQEEQDSDENQEYQENLDNAVDRITDAISQYEETDQLLEDIEDEMEDLNDQIQQLNFDAWTEKLELVIDKFDRYTTLLEHTNKLLGISGDNIYTAAQALTQQVGTLNADGSFSGGVYGQALDVIKELVGETAFEAFQGGASNVFEIAQQDANSAVGELYQKYQNGDINQAQYIEGLQQLQEQFYSLGDTIVEIDEYAFTAYREALEDGKERLERYTKVIDQAASQLDHMNNLLDLIGQQNDYEKKGVILEGQKEVSKANLDAKTSIYDMAKAQWEEVKANWDAMDDQQKEKYKDTYDAALDYYVEASDEWYSAQEDFAEKTKALAENELALAEKLARESILGEGVSWDAVSDQLDRYSSIGDEYLTKTNQIYEVTKLTRTIQSDIDKTSNTAAKKRLETFKKQTEELAKQEELTEYEMELQNKKYELLLAEIAMEEAQNAKSQVRLTRDSEGNYSYTYTTDEEEMQKAEDEYLQKQNDLYNFLLEGTNDYYTKYVETMREATETFSAINEAYLNGEIETEEEYHRQMLEAQQYYNNLMQTYKNLYNVAMDELGDQAVDSWTTDSGLIIDTTIQLNEDVGTEIDGIIDHGTRLDQSYNDFAKQYISYITNEKEELSGFTTFTETEHGKQQGYWNATQTAINEYYQEIDENIPIASKDIGDLRKEVEDVGNEAKNQAKNIDTLTTSIKDQLTEVDKIVTAWDQYADAVEKVREALAALQIDINGGIDAEGGNPEWGPGDGTEEPGDGNPTGGVTPPSGGGDISGSGKYGDYVTVTGNSPNRYFITSSGEKYHLTGTSYNGYSGSDPEAAEIQKAWDSYVSKNGYSKSMDWNTNKLDLKVIGLESGGYTGEWDDGSGRLALLHSKELVLNKEDTVNLLSSIELIRDLIKVIDLNALATAMNSISALSSNNCAPEQREPEHGKLEQDIHIEANFPNATDKEEILGAFRSLSDLASQYAHRK